MRKLFVAIALFAAGGSFAQEKTITSSEDKEAKIYQFVDKMPAPGFDLGEYLSQNLTYPENSRKKGIEGRVIVKFVVNEDGSISDAKVVRGVSEDLDREALRVIKAMPKWKPGSQNGKMVKVYFTQPISFKLQ